MYASILYRVQVFFTHSYTLGASGENGYDEKIDDQGPDKLLAALKR